MRKTRLEEELILLNEKFDRLEFELKEGRRAATECLFRAHVLSGTLKQDIETIIEEKKRAVCQTKEDML